MEIVSTKCVCLQDFRNKHLFINSIDYIAPSFALGKNIPTSVLISWSKEATGDGYGLRLSRLLEGTLASVGPGDDNGRFCSQFKWRCPRNPSGLEKLSRGVSTLELRCFLWTWVDMKGSFASNKTWIEVYMHQWCVCDRMEGVVLHL